MTPEEDVRSNLVATQEPWTLVPVTPHSLARFVVRNIRAAVDVRAVPCNPISLLYPLHPLA